jgi:hypothetical protein
MMSAEHVPLLVTYFVSVWQTEIYLCIGVLSWYERQTRLHKSGNFLERVFVILLKIKSGIVKSNSDSVMVTILTSEKTTVVRIF